MNGTTSFGATRHISKYSTGRIVRLFVVDDQNTINPSILSKRCNVVVVVSAYETVLQMVLEVHQSCMLVNLIEVHMSRLLKKHYHYLLKIHSTHQTKIGCSCMTMHHRIGPSIHLNGSKIKVLKYWVDAKVSADFYFKRCSATMDAWFSCI